MHLLVIHFWPTGSSVFIYPFGLTHAHNQTNRVSGVDSTNLLGVLSDTPTECVTQCAYVPSMKLIPDTMQTMH